jgi:hypothetical protein
VTCLRTCVLAWFPLLYCSLAFGQNGALRITEPVPAKDRTIMTSDPSIQLKGTLAWTGGDMRVLWNNQRGFSDLATVKLADDKRTVEWSTTAPIPLRPGINQVQIRALGQPGAGAFVNVYYSVQSPAPPPRQGATMFRGQQITYEEIDGRAVYQSDMILGSLEDVKAGRIAGRHGARPRSDTIAGTSGLWPIVNNVVRVPYTISATSGDLTNISAAIAESNAQLNNVVQWVPATGSDVYTVNFDFDATNMNGSCEAVVGFQNNPLQPAQPIGGAGNCTVPTILHEMGHALGLYHEQSRADRNNYITYSEAYVDKPQHANFDIFQSEVDSGLYNYASIMEYTSFLFSRFGVLPVIETKPAGIVLSTEMPQYTTGDLDGIQRLYGFIPSAVTVDTNPSGLQLVVDGNTCTAPCVFTNWALGSTHTLAVPTDSNSQTLQTLDQQPYIFGNWNATPNLTAPYIPTNSPSTSQSITITNAAGNGLPSDPISSPAYTNYLASYITVRPYNPEVSPAGAGTVTTIPAPSTLIINGVTTQYFPDRAGINLGATAKGAYTFYAWDNVPLPFLYEKQYNFYLNTNLDYLNFDQSEPVTAFFVSDVVTTVTGSTNDSQEQASGIYPGFTIGVVENSNSGATETVYTPRNFDQSQDGKGFAVSASLTLCASGWTGTTCPATPVTQSPVTTNMTYALSNWSGIGNPGVGVNAVTFTVPTSSQEENVSYTESGRLIIIPSISSQYCPGVQVSTSPAGTNSIGTGGTLDAFYPDGEFVNLSAVGDAGAANFVMWSGDLGSAESPYPQTLGSQTIATANFNVPGTSAALAIASTTPVTPTVTGLATNLIVTGTGFTSSTTVTYVYFGPLGGTLQYRSFTPASGNPSTQMTVALQAGDIATAGYYQIEVLNVGGGGCNPQTFYTFPVANQTGAPALTITKTHTGNFSAGQQNATYTINVENTGTVNTTEPVTVTETLPQGESLVSIAGSGWTCQTATGVTCTNSNTLAPSTSFNDITVTVNVAANAGTPQLNAVTVTGGGAPEASTTDSTIITTSVPNVVGLSQSTATTDIQNADLVAGTVTMSTSNTVAAGDVISTSPAYRATENAGTSVNLTVSSGPSLYSISVTPADPSIAIGATEQFTATGTYSNNATANLTAQVQWSSGSTNVATISNGQNGGLATAVASGNSTITATLGTVSGSTNLNVAPVTLVSIAVTPSSPSIANGLTQQFTATGTYNNASTQNITASVEWQSGNTNAARITNGQNGGLVSTFGTGTALISAALSGVSGSTTLTVTTATLQSITVTANSLSLLIGTMEPFTATGNYTNGPQTLTTTATWASDTPAVATVVTSGANGGIVTAAGVGMATISATYSGIKGSAVLTVAGLGACDVLSQGSYSVADAQREINEALGTFAPANDLNNDGVVNVVDVEIVINAVLNLGCTV